VEWLLFLLIKLSIVNVYVEPGDWFVLWLVRLSIIPVYFLIVQYYRDCRYL
jgi:hypothetical protein